MNNVTTSDLTFLPRSQPPGWECITRGSASGQATGGGASQNGFPA
ncbi:hypothetical protein [Nostoc sp. NMS4]|nr:hypothetical protein [Nostoc sp. NMS4]